MSEKKSFDSDRPPRNNLASENDPSKGIVTKEPIDLKDDDWSTDLENARNWTSGKKWTSVSIVSFYTFIPPFASSMMAPGLGQVARKYHITSSVELALTLSIYLLSFAIGPLILAPLSEMYGRTWVYHIGNIFSLVFNLGCAFSPTTGALVGFRFLAGLSGGTPLAIGGGSIADLFAEHERASAMAMFTLGPLLGPVIGPVAGGFIAQKIGIEWVFVVISILCAVAAAIGIPLLRETYAPIIRLRQRKKLRLPLLGDPEGKANIPAPIPLEQEKSFHNLWINLSRPIVILFSSLICFLFSLYMAFIYGIFYLMFATFPQFFGETYGFKPGVGGLAYLGLGVGFFLATIVGVKFSDQVYGYLASKNGGKATPEMRIPALFLGSLFVPVGLLWYGWSAEAKLHWIMPIIGSGIFGFGLMTSFFPIQLYLVDSFTYAASVTAAAAFFRSFLGFAFPLFGQRMSNSLGIGPANSLLAGLAIVLGIPFPICIYFKGESMRARNPLTSGLARR